MDRFAKLWASQENISNSPDQRAAPDPEPSVLGEEEQIHSTVVVNARSTAAAISVQRVAQEVVDLCNLPADPAQRRPMSQFKTAKVRDDVRRAYLQKGPFQPKNHSFPQTDMSGIPRRFNSAWFSKYGGWLEYSIDEDVVYCLCCYLFQNESLGHGGGDAFSRKGWRLWNKATRLDVHVGGPSSAHNQNMKRCDDLVNQNQSISACQMRITTKVLCAPSSICCNRFSETGTTLLLGMGCLDPSDSFSNFEKDKILAMARLYPDDFATESKIEELSCQLDNFVENIRDDSRFSDLKGVGDLCKKSVEKKKHTTFPLVFLLLKLILVLPVATATVERAFSAMKYIKSDLRNRIGDDFLNHCLITYVETDVFQLISTDAIMHTYQGYHDRGELLP